MFTILFLERNISTRIDMLKLNNPAHGIGLQEVAALEACVA
jgi:hypothetical protein